MTLGLHSKGDTGYVIPYFSEDSFLKNGKKFEPVWIVNLDGLPTKGFAALAITPVLGKFSNDEVELVCPKSRECGLPFINGRLTTRRKNVLTNAEYMENSQYS